MGMKIIAASAMALCLAACAPTTTESSATAGAMASMAAQNQIFGPDDFQSFVKNWDGDAPLCARIASQADFDRYFGAAAVMGGNKPFGPPEALWRTHTGYLLAREANGGSNINQLLQVLRVERGAGSVNIDTVFASPASGSYQVNTFVLVAVPKPVSGRAEFREGGRPVCSVRA